MGKNTEEQQVIFTARDKGATRAAKGLGKSFKTLALQAAAVGISLGAVFMGAMTYIGNGPNFMVKSIAEQGGVRMPSFFGYMIYSVAILIPVFLLVTFLFV